MKFDDWIMAEVDDLNEIDGKPALLLTTLLYKVCGEDKTRFEEAIRILRLTYEAGKSAHI